MFKNSILVTLLLASTWLVAQESNIQYPTLNEQCGTVPMHQFQQQELRQAASDAEFEEWISRKIQETDFSSRGIITIPIVVHVIHNGEQIGSLPNINDAQVLSQIEALNEDFRRTPGSNGFNSHPDGADTEIEFCLAAIDPQGNPTTGINRVNLGVNTWDSNSADGSMKPNTIWDPEQYFNVWVCNLQGGLLGYAQFPSGSGLQGLNGGAANTDGVVIGAQYFGAIDKNDGTFQMDNTYNLGRTLTHEIGHSLGLRHIWGDGGCGVDDYCDDTPESDASNGGCPTGHTSCNTVDMIENYMDYTADACMNIFTNNQKTRMLAVMANSPRRVNLATSVVCNPPASFAYTGQVVDAATGQGIAGAKVKFSGTFSPETTSATDGTFTMSNLYTGDYEVLVGSWGYVTSTNPTQSFDENTGSIIFELDQGYYDDFVLDFAWTVSGDAETGEWVKGEPGGASYQNTLYDPANDVTGDIGNECYLTGNSGGSAGSNDVDNGTTTLTSPSFDATSYDNPKVSFYRWFMIGGGQGAAPDDMLEITLSNGTQTITLETMDANSNDLGQWVYKEFVIGDYLPITNNMQLEISTSDEVTSTEGHLVDAALDLFRVEEAGGVNVDENLATDLSFSLSPNPNNGQFEISVSNMSSSTQIQIFDALGRLINSQEITNGTNAVNLSSQPTGVYFVQVQQDGRSFVRKIVKK